MPTIGPIVEEMALNPSVYSFELLTFKESPVNESAAISSDTVSSKANSFTRRVRS